METDIIKLVKNSTLNELVEAKVSMVNRLKEIEGGYVESRRTGKKERAFLKECLKKVNKRITELTAVTKE